MTQVLSKPHASAIEFHGLAIQVIGETTVPGPETQVHEQAPTNGLYYRHSGRLLTSQSEGNFVQRVQAGHKLGKLFELQRVGAVARQAPQIVTARRVNPVYSLAADLPPSYVAMRWTDKQGFHQATPQYHEGSPLSVTVQSWLGARVMETEFLVDASAICNRKVTSAEHGELALELYHAAMQAYAAVQL